MKKEIVVAGGCFWGVEAYFQKVKGIVDTTVGYANGNSDETTYQVLKQTDHVEAVKIIYDDQVIYLAEIIQRLISIVEPFSLNKQGHDIGRQYRIGVYYQDRYSYLCAKKCIALFEEKAKQKSYLELEELRHFIKAEDYHQDYLLHNPNGYCHLDLSVLKHKLSASVAKTEDEIAALHLDELSLSVMLQQKTERPFTSLYNQQTQVGLYVDKISGQALFSTQDQYDAGCGWPSFTRAIQTDAIDYIDDFSHNMYRVETKSSVQKSHLGHVFTDGLKDRGSLRYCINGAALSFIPLEQLVEFGYQDYLVYFDDYILKG